MSSIFRKSEQGAVCEPRQLIGEPLALGCGKAHLDRKAARKDPRDGSLQPPNLVEIGDDPFRHPNRCVRPERNSAWRNIDRHAVEFLAIGAHEPSRQLDIDALMAAALDACGFRDAPGEGAQARAP